MSRSGQNNSTEPKVVGFVCNWSAYSAVDMAGVHGAEYSPGIKLVRVACMGRLSLGVVLRAFELGADGVLLLSCPPEECHYESGATRAKEMAAQARKTLGLLGIDPRKLAVVEAPLGRDDELVKKVAAFVKYIKKASLISAAGDQLAEKAVKAAALLMMNDKR